MRNKILMLLLVLSLTFSLVACGDKDIKKNDLEDKNDLISTSTEVEIVNENEENIKQIDHGDHGDHEGHEDHGELSLNDFNKNLFINNCDFVHVISENYETTKSDVVKGIQVQKIVYNVTDEHKIFVNSDVNNNSAGLFIIRVGTNKISDIERLNVAEIFDLDKDLYTVDVFKTPCCHYYVFRLKMPLTEDSIRVGFGIDEYVTYHELKEMSVYKKGYSHIGEEIFCEGSIADLDIGDFLITRNERELNKDISTENEHIALKQSVIELLPLNGVIKMNQIDASKWFVRDLNGDDLFEKVDELGGLFTYTITTVSPEYRNEYNNEFVHSIYITYKYINENLTGEDLEKQMNKIIFDSFVSYTNSDTEFNRNFVIN